MANMKLLLAAALIGTVSAAKECKYGSCIYMNGPQFQTGDKWGDLALLKTRPNAGKQPGPFEKCSCTDKYEAAPGGYTGAYSVTCAGRLEDQGAAPGPAYTAAGVPGTKTKIYEKGQGATAEKCASRCNATVGCGGFIFNYYDAEMTCNAVGVNAYCKGTVVKGDENKDYPAGPGKDNGLLTSRDGSAVFMLETAPMAAPASWANVDSKMMQRLIDMQAGGKQPGPEDICIAEGKDPKACQKLETQGLNSGSAASASLVALAVAAAAAVKMF